LDETGALVMQDDGVPREGRYPTSAWQEGDLVPDMHQVTLPEERSNGPFYWSVGLYDPTTKERLPVVGPEGRVLHDAIRLEAEK
jgi:hypothetical protein